MRLLRILRPLLRIQVLLGLVQYVGLFLGFAWPSRVWALHRVIGLIVPAVALIAFRRGAWSSTGRPQLGPFEPGVRVAARFALLAPLALGLCFGAGVVGGLGWITVHIGLAVAALYAIERAATDLFARVVTPDLSGESGPSLSVGAPDESMECVSTMSTIQNEDTTHD
jgi:hypothetical protein